MKKTASLLMLLLVLPASAVYVNEKGLGDALLIPYYTVNNNLNTLVSVTNTTENTKAIKINIREGLNGHAVLSYNVYVGAFDVWTFALVPKPSTVAGFMGQDSAAQFTTDLSCAPFIRKTSGEEFIAAHLVDGPQDISRVREGYIEIIEMGEFLPGMDFYPVADHGANGMPSSCEMFEEAWQTDGLWDVETGGNPNRDTAPVSGGLMAEADVINVSEGINFSIPVVALNGFFAADTIAHFSPYDDGLSLDAAEPRSTIIANNKAYELDFDSGIDAVTSVLMADELMGSYALDRLVAGKNETVFVQPTRRFYTRPDVSLNNPPPFNQSNYVNGCPYVAYGGTELKQLVFDRANQSEIPNSSTGVMGPPPTPNAAICGSVFVQSIILSSDTAQPRSKITQSKNHNTLESPSMAHATENGYVWTRFLDTRPLLGTDINSNESVQLMGLPVIGITLQQFTNAGADEGLLAQYGGSHKLKSKVTVRQAD